MRKILLLAAASLLLGASVRAGETIDVQALAAKLRAQEAMMNDLEAKMGYQACDEKITADELTSLRKNATVTIGGLVTTGYYYGAGKGEKRDGNFDADAANADPGTYSKAKYRLGSLEMSDAELYTQIEVNEHFDAFLYLDLHNVDSDAANGYALAKAYYVRWKNICNTGIGLKVGRDRAAFGDSGNQMGYLDSWAAGGGDGMGWYGVEEVDGWAPRHNGWKYNAVTQFTPYWEGLDGKLKVELSLFQNAWNGGGKLNGVTGGVTSYYYDGNGARKYRSRNMGAGSGSFRVQYSPIEGLNLTASVINFHSKRWIDDDGIGVYTDNGGAFVHAANNTAVNLAFSYTPCFLDKLTVWGQWVHGWNVDNVRKLKSDVLNFGLGYALTDALTVFAQGDYLRTRHNPTSYSGTGLAFYAGASYELSVGAVLEAGWRHEYIKDKFAGRVQYTGRADSFYANIGFEF